MTRLPARVVLVLGLCALGFGFGCGEGKRATVNVSGTVTFKGKAVPYGFINFMPDFSAGNKGEVKGFPIVDGAYNTAEGSSPGIYAGANVITISGFDGKKQNLWPKGKQIFNPIELKETVGEGKKDYVVPESAGQNVRIVPTADPDGP